jgi:hypothetical protein
MSDKPEKPQTTSRIGRAIRYCAAAGCLLVILLWDAKEPPILDMAQMQVTEGLYNCIEHDSGKYSKTGPHIVDGVLYYDTFSYIFGIRSAGICFSQWNGHRVRMYYLAPPNETRRLVLEVLDLESRRIYGIRKEKHFFLYQEQVANKWPFYLSKLGLLLLALRLTCWNTIRAFFQAIVTRFGPQSIER